MYIERILSVNNGWSVLTTQKHDEWQEVLTSLIPLAGDDQTADELNRNSASILYAMYYLAFTKRLREKKWLQTSEVSIPFQPSVAKNRVSAGLTGIEGMMGAGFASDFYLNIPHQYQVDSIDVGVMLIPTINASSFFIQHSRDSSDIYALPNEESCRAEIVKYGPLTSQAPIVLAFFSPTIQEEITIEEVVSVKISASTIERTIEFAPEYYQAGVGLLSYFGEVLRQKAPNTKAKVRIEQDGRIVRLHIESPDGNIETIEKELDQYALVISNQAPPESLFEQRMHIMQLESKLEVAKVEIKNAYDLKQLTDGFYSQQVRDLKEQVDSLTKQVATGLLQQNKVFNLMHQQASSHERVQLAMLTQSGVLFKDLLQEANDNQRLIEAVQNLHQNLLAGITTVEIEDQLDRALATIKEAKPGFIGRIFSEFQGAAYKTVAGSSIGWVVEWITKHK